MQKFVDRAGRIWIVDIDNAAAREDSHRRASP